MLRDVRLGLRCLACMCHALLVGAAVSTPWQQARFKAVEQRSIARARESKAQLENRLAAADVRVALLDCCADWSKASAEELRQRISEEIAVSEIVSAFSARSPGGPAALPFWFGPSLEEAANATEFDNLWSVWLTEGTNLSTGFLAEAVSGLDDTETHYYGLRPFRRRGSPASLTEAGERGVYALVNLLRDPAGSPLYGDVSIVLSPQIASSTALLSACDTGSWHAMCNTTGSMNLSHAYPHNCSAIDAGALGTMRTWERTLLQNEAYWANTSALLLKLQRMLAPPSSPPPIRGVDLVKYLEAVPAATIEFASDVRARARGAWST